MPSPLQSAALLSFLSIAAAALGAPVLCSAGLAWALLSALGAPRALRLYQLLFYAGVVWLSQASWLGCLLLSAPVTIAAVAGTLSSPTYRGPGLALWVGLLQNNRTPSHVVSTWTAPQKSPQTASALDPVPARLRACDPTPAAGLPAN